MAGLCHAKAMAKSSKEENWSPLFECELLHYYLQFLTVMVSGYCGTRWQETSE